MVFGSVVPGRIGIEVAAGEDDLLAVGPEVTARRPASARTDSSITAGIKVHDKDLIERIACAFFFRLEDNLLHVRRKVTLPGTHKIVAHLADVPQVNAFELLPAAPGHARDKACENEKHQHSPSVELKKVKKSLPRLAIIRQRCELVRSKMANE